MRKAPALAALIVLLCLSIPRAASADFRSSYRKGLSAVDQNEWSEVLEAMQEATAEEPTASKKMIKHYGTRFVPYTPYYYLGLAHYHLGHCAEAVKAWETSASQGVADLGDVQEYLEECRREAAAIPTKAPTATPVPVATLPPTPAGPDPRLLDEARRAAERAVQGAESALGQVKTWRAEPDMAQAMDRDAALRQSFSQATERLASARSTLEKGVSEKNLAIVKQATELASQAQREAEGIVPRLRKIEDDLVQARADRELERMADQTRRQDEAARAADARQTATAAARRALPPSPVPEITTPSGPPPAPSSLRSAAQRFLSGDYSRTVSLLADEAFTNSRASALAHLLRAAARFGIYCEGGQRDDSLRTMAEDDVRSCKRLDSSITPKNDAFSPRFVTFFNTTR